MNPRKKELLGTKGRDVTDLNEFRRREHPKGSDTDKLLRQLKEFTEDREPVEVITPLEEGDIEFIDDDTPSKGAI